MLRWSFLLLSTCLGAQIQLNLLDDAGETAVVSWDPAEEDVLVASKRFAGHLYQEDAGCVARDHDQACAAHEIEVRLRLHQAEQALGARASAGPLKVEELLPYKGQALRKPFQETVATIALYNGHDASIAVGVNGRIQCVLELERLFGRRYYQAPADPELFRSEWLEALSMVASRCDCEGGTFPERFQHGVIVYSGKSSFGEDLPELVSRVLSVEEWHLVGHHKAHAAMGLHASPFRSALVLTYDAEFIAYVATNGAGLQQIAHFDYNLGTAYLVLSALLPEVTGVPSEVVQEQCSWTGDGPLLPFVELSWAGKLMGYAATGASSKEIRDIVRTIFQSSGALPKLSAEMLLSPGAGKTDFSARFREVVLEKTCTSVEAQRALAASAQEEFESFVHEIVMAIVEHVGAQNIDGVVLTGGCALNVLANQKIHDSLVALTEANASSSSWQSGRKPLEVYVPAAPSDPGLTVGGVWAVTPPPVQQSLQYLGFHLWDGESLEALAQAEGARRLSELGGIEFLADLLAGGEAWLQERQHLEPKPIVAVVRGRQEFGPRALGHRSLLAVPDSNHMRDRMNRLKSRQWYRPVAPMIADEALEQVFGRVVKSVAMTMAPAVRKEVLEKFPALAHLDGTARHQSVGKDDEPWVHQLLLAVGRRTGLAALINTSFNTKGKPITNSIREALDMLSDLPDLDYVVIDDWIFHKRSRHKK